LAKIKKFCIENPDKIIIATGDTCQLEPINEYTNTKNYEEYADECINQIFPFEIYLEEQYVTERRTSKNIYVTRLCAKNIYFLFI
jgi:hypothetical protein